jgi:hypothetical protein
MKSLLKNHVVRLVAGNLAAVLLVLGLPTVVVLRTVGHWGWVTALVATLVCLHLALLGIEVAATGQPVPTKWNAAFFMPLPVLDASATVGLLQAGEFGWALFCLLLTATAAFVAVLTARKTWRRMTSPERMVVVAPLAQPTAKAVSVPEEDHASLY